MVASVIDTKSLLTTRQLDVGPRVDELSALVDWTKAYLPKAHQVEQIWLPSSLDLTRISHMKKQEADQTDLAGDYQRREARG